MIKMAYTSSNQTNIFAFWKYIINFVNYNSRQTLEYLISKRLGFYVSQTLTAWGLKQITMKGKSDMKSDVMKFVSTFSIFGKDDQIKDGSNNVAIDNSSASKPSKTQENQHPVQEPVQPPKVVAYITKGQVINGSIISSDEIVIEGVVNGDIESSADVTVTGQVNGNIIGNTINIDGATVTGNIKARATLYLCKCQVTGDISGESIEVNGNIDGSITAIESCDILENAVVHGDVISSVLTVKKNALIKGNITMSDK